MATSKTTSRRLARKRRPKRVRVQVKFALFHCRRCKSGYNWPFTHVCVIGFTAAQKAAVRRNLEAARKVRKASGGKP